MKNPSTPNRLVYAIAGLGLLVYGLKTILVREISAVGAAWTIQGELAALIGFLLGVLGAYIFTLSFRR